MVAKTEDTAAQAAQANPWADLEAELQSPDAFKREELFSFNTVVELEIVPADEDWMSRRNINFNSPEFKQLFPSGYPVLKIGRRGVDVRYKFSADEVARDYIPIYNHPGESNPGRRKGRRSRLQITVDAFQKVYGVPPIGADNQARIIAAGPAQWGQYLGEFTPAGQSESTEWAWPIPRKLMPQGWKYDGEVRDIEGTAAASDSGAAGTVGTAQLSAEESLAKVVEALVGLDAADLQAARDAVMNIPGLTQDWYDAATDGNPAAKALDAGAPITNDDGKIALKEE